MPARLTGIAPHFLVEDVGRATDYYRDRLGFSVMPGSRDPATFAMVSRDTARLQLSRMEGGRGGSNRKWKPSVADIYIWVNNVDELYRELVARQADIVGPMQRKHYGTMELEVRDPDGYILCFAQYVGM